MLFALVRNSLLATSSFSRMKMEKGYASTSRSVRVRLQGNKVMGEGTKKSQTKVIRDG